MSNTDLAVVSAETRVDMERRETVRLAGELLFYPQDLIPRETIREHVVALLLASCHKQERWSRHG